MLKSGNFIDQQGASLEDQRQDSLDEILPVVSDKDDRIGTLILVVNKSMSCLPVLIISSFDPPNQVEPLPSGNVWTGSHLDASRFHFVWLFLTLPPNFTTQPTSVSI